MAQPPKFFYRESEAGIPRKDELLLVPYRTDQVDAQVGSLLDHEAAIDLSAFIENQEVAAAHPELLEELLKPSRFPPMNVAKAPETTFQVLRHSTSSISSVSGTPTSAPAYQTQSMLSFDSSAATPAGSASTSRCPSPTTASSAVISSSTSKRSASTSMGGGGKRKTPDKTSDEYRKRRERNNIAVKKSREKSRQRSLETEQRVAALTQENQQLHNRITLLTKELEVLKSLFANNQAVATRKDS